jgi:hypothetical protein
MVGLALTRRPLSGDLMDGKRSTPKRAQTKKNSRDAQVSAPRENRKKMGNPVLMVNLERAMRARGLDRGDIVRALAENPLTQTSKATVGRWLTSKACPSGDQIVAVARLLEVPVEYLYDPEASSELPEAGTIYQAGVPASSVVLTDEQKQILWVVEKMTYQIAISRLLDVHPSRE